MENFDKYELGVTIDENGSFYLESISDSKNGLAITHLDSKNNLRLVLNFGIVYCYRVTNESYRLKFLEETEGKLSGIVSTTSNSDFLHWFHEESKNIYINNNVIHFLVVSADDVIDILSSNTVKCNLETID